MSAKRRLRKSKREPRLFLWCIHIDTTPHTQHVPPFPTDGHIRESYCDAQPPNRACDCGGATWPCSRPAGHNGPHAAQGYLHNPAPQFVWANTAVPAIPPDATPAACPPVTRAAGVDTPGGHP